MSVPIRVYMYIYVVYMGDATTIRQLRANRSYLQYIYVYEYVGERVYVCRSYEGHLTGRNEYSCCKFSLRRYSTLVYRLVIERLLYRSLEAYIRQVLGGNVTSFLSLSIIFYILRTYRKGSFLLFFGFFWSHFIKIKIRFGFSVSFGFCFFCFFFTLM